MAGIGNVKGVETLRRPLRLDYNCGRARIRAFPQCERAHYENTQQYALLVWKGSNYQLNLLADQTGGHNAFLSASQSALYWDF